MATIKVTKNEFPDIVVMFMMDYIMDNKIVIDNDNWDYFVDKMMGKGIKPQLLKYYIDIDAIEKSKYKEVKGIFSGKGNRSTINIVNNDKQEKTNTSKIKRIIRKVLNITEKRRNKYRGFPLTDDIIDDIINKVVNEEVKERGIIEKEIIKDNKEDEW